MGRIIAIGDIHGCYYTLRDLLQKVHYNTEKDILIFVGDYIDRRKHSRDVVRFVMKLQADHGEKVIALSGNHEQLAVDANGHPGVLWYVNGGEKTYLEYKKTNSCVPVEWFKHLPLYYETENFIFCHAGLSWPVLKENSKYDLIWGRDWIEKDERTREKKVIFGHTPSKNDFPYTTKTGDICIDGGCVFGGNLCCVIIEDKNNFSFVAVPKKEKD